MVSFQHIRYNNPLEPKEVIDNMVVCCRYTHYLFLLLKMKSKRKIQKKTIIDKNKNVPLWEKYTLSVDEAALYFGIGQNRLRSLIACNPDAEYLVTIGAKTMIKRKIFEKYLDTATAI